MSNNYLEQEDQSDQSKGFSSDESSATGFNELIAQWWNKFSLRAKLLAIATLVVSFLMTGITFFALSSIFCKI